MYSARSDRTRAYQFRLRSGWLSALAAMILGLGAVPASAQCVEEQKLTASDAWPGATFGRSVSVSGHTAVVGAAGDECADGYGCGSAYVYRFDGTSWVEEQKLTASDAASLDEFGRAVSVNGDTVVVAAQGNDCAAGADCGSAYAFRFNGSSWVEEQKLTASDAEAFVGFGSSVSVYGDTVVVGAAFDDCVGGIWCGSAYVYRFGGTAWVERQKLTASDARARDRLGWSVSVDRDTVVVGAVNASCKSNSSNCGAVYVFRFNETSWIQEQKLNASDKAGAFGVSASLHGNTVVVGVPGDACPGLPGTSCGSAYVFRFNGAFWVEEQKLTASDSGWADLFGNSVSVSGDTIVVGAFWDDISSLGLTDDRGSAYVFRFNGHSWVEEQKLIATDAAPSDEFGVSVSVSGDTVFVGAWLDRCPPGVSRCGSAYVFSCASAPVVVNLDFKPGSCPNMVNPRSRGVVPGAIVGSSDFDVATIDPDSLTLARADGVGESVSPFSGRGGRGIVIKDVATPFAGEPCACHALGGDGIDDVAMKFSTSEMSRAFQLNGLPRGTTIELVMQGSLQDGTTFEAVDCIVIPGTERNSIRRHHIKRP